ncbi:class I SAM-dependent methyltransferase [Halomonas sp. 328]|uniref:class I SAM-dependent methyltransferase n=1 Tax=Halomonas sp. 328 TaxID=2776704 RepID=UPI0018A793A2|nr:class I SAM-dependent methyltransferase [Halomonas sp. 328]MBF8223651.1 class I SAM-dependent methyltransferase [Halomonas sp. 328]
MSETTPDVEALKAKLKKTWNSGDYGTVAKYLESSAEEFLARIPIDSAERVLDVACGSGQAAIPLAKSGAEVTGVDIAPQSLQQARVRAKAEGLDIQFDEGDAEVLPYEDASFDLVISLIGAMFAPRPERVAQELVRVCRPGGRIVMANWTLEGFIGLFLKMVGKHVPPPPMPSPLLWGDETTVRERLSEGIADLQTIKRIYPFRYPFPPSEVVEHYREYYGPVTRAFSALDAAGQKALSDDLEKLWTEHNLATDGTTYVEAEILEVVAVRG